jgi:hypothetical protein
LIWGREGTEGTSGPKSGSFLRVDAKGMKYKKGERKGISIPNYTLSYRGNSLR